jgi:hypothetical protein
MCNELGRILWVTSPRLYIRHMAKPVASSTSGAVPPPLSCPLHSDQGLHCWQISDVSQVTPRTRDPCGGGLGRSVDPSPLPLWMDTAITATLAPGLSSPRNPAPLPESPSHITAFVVCLAPPCAQLLEPPSIATGQGRGIGV